MNTNREPLPAIDPESGQEQRQERLTSLVDKWQHEGIPLDEMLAMVDEEIETRGAGLAEDLER